MLVGAILVWWSTTTVLLLVAVPIAGVLVPERGRGASLALPIAWIVFIVVGLWVGHVSLALAMPVSLLVLIGLAAVARYRSPSMGMARSAGRAVLAYTGTFLAFTVLRAGAPGITPHGEQFLDVWLIRALGRASSLPAEDAWFAGDSIQYYYGGHLLTAELIDLSGVGLRWSFHLAIASVLAAVTVAGAGIAARAAARSGGDPRIAGVAGAGLVGLGGHVAALGWVLHPFVAIVEDATAFILPGTVAVFPLLEVLEGTLHAHVFAAPILAVAVGVGRAVLRTRDRRRLLVLVGVAAPLVVGSLVVTSTWAAPSAMGVLALCLWWRDPPVTVAGLSDPTRIQETIIGTGIAGVLAVLIAAPFLLTTAHGYPVVLQTPGMQSGLVPLFAIYGGLLLVLGLGLVARMERRGLAMAIGLALLGLGLSTVPGIPSALFIGLPVAVVAAERLVHRRDAGTIEVLAIAGAGLVVLVEVIYVLTDGPGNRFNTLFKTSMHIWIVWTIAAGGALGVIHNRVGELLTRRDVPDGTTRRIAIVTVMLLLVPSMAYAGFAIPDHFASADPLTLDGTHLIDEQHPQELAAIRWLDRAVSGQPTMVSAPGTKMYTWSAAPAASLTGIPTIAGWAHERQYRSPAAYQRRVRAVDRIYAGPADRRITLLEQYDVRYIYAGPTERNRYGTLPRYAEYQGIRVAYRNSVVTIYEVDQDRLSVPPAKIQ